MSIHFISGKPGGGKSMYAMKLVIEELLHGRRCVVTNLAIKMGGLNEYLQREYPQKNIDLFERIRILNDDETCRFWTVRGHYDAKIPILPKASWQEGRKPSYAGVADDGVFYAIDEVHNFFNARAWMEVGRDVLFYLSQHRKLGDTVLAITQAVENVDKQFRSVSQDYTYIRNLSKERAGVFSLPSMFVRRTYGSPATAMSSPMESGSFRLDAKGIGGCYDTAQGVGIHNRGNADLKEKKKGIPWYVFVVIVPLCIIVFVKTFPAWFAGWWTKPLQKQQITQAAQTNAPVKVPSFLPPTNTSGAAKEGRAKEKEVKMVGYALTPGNWEVFLSNGRRLQSSRGEFAFLCEDYVDAGGKRYYRNRETPSPQVVETSMSENEVINPDLYGRRGPSEVIIFGTRGGQMGENPRPVMSIDRTGRQFNW